jgi:cysteinyl-tRNA synthetase
MGAAREVLRELLTLFGRHLAAGPGGYEATLDPVVEALLRLRSTLREQKNWEAADVIRDILEKAGVMVEDTVEGTRWYFQKPQPAAGGSFI